MKKSIRIIVTILLVIGFLAFIAYVLTKNKKKNEAQTAIVAEKSSAVAVKADTVDYSVLSGEYVSNGTFAAKQEVMISSETSGIVSRIFVKEGAYVRAGQTLAVIKADKLNVNVANTQAIYNNAKTDLARFESAFKTGGVTQQQVDQAKLQLENAKNNLRSAQLSASDVNITASFSGIINKKMIEPGTYVNPGMQLFEVVNVSTLKLKVDVDEKNIAALRPGQNVKILSSVIPDRSWVGVITFIAPKADASLNFPVEIEIRNNADNQLKAGMYGSAYFGSDKPMNVLAVPRNAFVGNVSSNQVFVIRDGKAILTQVVAGRNFGDEIEIISGLEKGQVVVVSGQINLFNETPVEIIK